MQSFSVFLAGAILFFFAGFPGRSRPATQPAATPNATSHIAPQCDVAAVRMHVCERDVACRYAKPSSLVTAQHMTMQDAFVVLWSAKITQPNQKHIQQI